jgi:heat shock protein HslJ
VRPRVAGPLLGLLSLLVTAACGGGSSDPGLGAAPGFASSTTSTTAPPRLAATALDGRTFATDEIDGYDLIDGTDLRLTFTDGRLTAYAGCSSMVAPYELAGGRVSWSAGPVIASAVCPDARRLQDGWVQDRLLIGMEASLDDEQLRLATDDITMVLDQIGEVQEPDGAADAPLLGTRWLLLRAIGVDGPLEPPSGSAAPSLRISGNEAADIFGGCNQGTAPVALERGGALLRFGELVITDIRCDDEATALEALIRSVLDGPTIAAVSGQRLTISKGTDALIYQAA